MRVDVWVLGWLWGVRWSHTSGKNGTEEERESYRVTVVVLHTDGCWLLCASTAAAASKRRGAQEICMVLICEL